MSNVSFSERFGGALDLIPSLPERVAALAGIYRQIVAEAEAELALEDIPPARRLELEAEVMHWSAAAGDLAALLAAELPERELTPEELRKYTAVRTTCGGSVTALEERLASELPELLAAALRVEFEAEPELEPMVFQPIERVKIASGKVYVYLPGIECYSLEPDELVSLRIRYS